MSPTNSIEAAVWVALGGAAPDRAVARRRCGQRREELVTVAFPEYWLFFLGALFIVVTLYLPKRDWPAEKRGEQ